MLDQIIRREMTWFYPWLLQLSRRLLGRERAGHTLQPTALAHEVLGKLFTWDGQLYDSSKQGLQQLAASVARKSLVDSGRRYKVRLKAMDKFRLAEEQRLLPTSSTIQALLDAIERLRQLDPQLARLVELRFLEGYSNQEAIELLNLSPRTAARKWRFAKSYLAKAISNDEKEKSPYP